MIPRKPSPGDPIDFSTQTQGDFIDAVEALRVKQYSEVVDKEGGIAMPLGNIVQVVNNTDTVIPWYGIVEIEESRHDPAEHESDFKGEILFGIVKPTAEDDKVIGIAQEPINIGCIGSIMLAGVTQVQVDVSAEEDESSTCAKPQEDDVDKLTFTSAGPVHILWKPEGYGTKWAIVCIGFANFGYDRCNAVLKGAISGSGLKTVDAVVATRGDSPLDDPDDTTEELSVSNDLFEWEGDDDANCKIEYNHADQQWEFYQVECSTEEE